MDRTHAQVARNHRDGAQTGDGAGRTGRSSESSLPQSAKAALTRARALAWQLRRQEEQGGLRVFLYHRISVDHDPLALHPTEFRSQMELLASKGYRALDVTTALDKLYAGTLEPGEVALTFDDGFRDVMENALEVLVGLGFAATVFVATEVIDGTATYSWAPTAPMLSWDDVRALDAEGVMRFEPHSLTHPNLTRLDDQDCRREVGDSKLALEEQLGRATSTFCYPGGFISTRVRDLVGDAGYRYGITCEPGLNTPATDPLLVTRIQVDRTDRIYDFAAKVNGSHDRPLPGRRFYRRLRYGSTAERPRDAGRGSHIVMVAPLYAASEGPVAAAAMRSRGLATGLADRGHRVTVVCGMPHGTQAAPHRGVEVIAASWVDFDSLARTAGLKSGTLVQPRVGGGPPRHTLVRRWGRRLVPDRYATWVPAAIVAARRASGDAAVIISTGPRSSHIVARASRGHLPWIADINDIWALNPHFKRGAVKDRTDQFMERNTIGEATWLTSVNARMCEELERRFDQPATTILTGFDPADFADLPAPDRTGPVRILFAGTVYDDLDLTALLQAVRGGIGEGWLSPEKLRVAFIGRLTERVAHEAREYGVTGVVETGGLLPRAEALEAMARADALLLPLYKSDPLSLPMRFFEYVGVGRPIIAFGPPDRIGASLIREHKLGVVVSSTDEVASLLHALVDDRDFLPVPDPAERYRFTWEHSIDRLNELVLELERAASAPVAV